MELPEARELSWIPLTVSLVDLVDCPTVKFSSKTKLNLFLTGIHLQQLQFGTELPCARFAELIRRLANTWTWKSWCVLLLNHLKQTAQERQPKYNIMKHMIFLSQHETHLNRHETWRSAENHDTPKRRCTIPSRLIGPRPYRRSRGRTYGQRRVSQRNRKCRALGLGLRLTVMFRQKLCGVFIVMVNEWLIYGYCMVNNRSIWGFP